MELLISNGIDVNVKNKNKKTAKENGKIQNKKKLQWSGRYNVFIILGQEAIVAMIQKAQETQKPWKIIISYFNILSSKKATIIVCVLTTK